MPDRRDSATLVKQKIMLPCRFIRGKTYLFFVLHASEGNNLRTVEGVTSLRYH